jgi:hypothetical protein
LGTYMPYSLEKRPSGGFESRPCKDYKDEWVINLFCLMSILCVLVLFFFPRFDDEHHHLNERNDACVYTYDVSYSIFLFPLLCSY